MKRTPQIHSARFAVAMLAFALVGFPGAPGAQLAAQSTAPAAVQPDRHRWLVGKQQL